MKNINLDNLNVFIEKCKQDDSLLSKEISIEVNWNNDENKSQMYCELSYPLGRDTLYVDQVDFLGGGGRSPNPIQYCLLGIASCFLSTFALVCKQMQIDIKKLKIRVENRINLDIPLNLGNRKVSEGIELKIFVDSKESFEKLEEAKNIALKRCPAIWCLTNPINVNANINKIDD